MAYKTELEDLKKGDTVWIGTQHYKRMKVARILKITATQFVLEHAWSSDSYRFSRDTGRCVGGGNGNSRITGKATPKEIDELDKKVSAENAARALQLAAEAEIETTRQKLFTLFTGNVNISNYPPDGWTLELSHLTEAQVRTIAERLAHVEAEI